MALRVAIAGAGVGGLCLAQGLRAAGAQVAVYERDPAVRSRHQGYRLRVDRHGNAALRACLPPELHELFLATACPPYMSRGSVYDHHLTLRHTHRDPAPFDPAQASRGVNRLTLRQVLLAGLDDTVHFGHTVLGYSSTGEGVRVHFAGGGSAEADLLVGADGINSVIRRQLLPAAGVVDTGLRAIYGQAPLTSALRELLPAGLFGGSCPVLGPHRRTLALGSFEPVTPPAVADPRLDPVAAYLKWTLVAPGFTLTEPELWTATPRRLLEEARQAIAGWHPALAELLARSVVPVTFPLAIRAGSAVPAWPSGPVTVLGDAVHATTPVGGTGANTALRDAALLTQRLRPVLTGAAGLREAVSGYEAEMREYGSAAVRNSLLGAERIFRADPREFSPALTR
ncbi:FAD-dependent monooxygenase [Crossiella sp. SN42]|uniref:FAD-dependent oxidoreductase n=1 Tax=Crossiella sp. SN42 TaxID=2944808 RepID=UPI00207C3E88|nr:FAD-dependent monooxygenase [Crossiella sp. SN42]MCO1580328.1 FAD-dependent monooxygenase [Crossiella sp. SN42]